MILSNVEIIKCLEKGLISIEPLKQRNPAQVPFNTTGVDLSLANEIVEFSAKPANTIIDLWNRGLAPFLSQNSSFHNISVEQPFILKPYKLVLARTAEKISLPLIESAEINYCGRIEGRSSLARCGILVHFTAPTIHAGFTGVVTIEMINLGPFDFLLYPGMPICTLMIEEVKGCPITSPNQFTGQRETGEGKN